MATLGELSNCVFEHFTDYGRQKGASTDLTLIWGLLSATILECELGIRMNPYSNFFCDALSGPSPVVKKHLPRLLLKCCWSSFPAVPLGSAGGHYPSKEMMVPSAKITHMTIVKLRECTVYVHRSNYTFTAGQKKEKYCLQLKDV